jgi:indoleamine 2,3-dioxygenase
MDFENLELIRSFTGSQSEIGFILVHCTMVSRTTGVVRATLKTLDACRNDDRYGFNEGMKEYQEVMNSINREMDTMWTRSNPAHYNDFRTFIMGIKDQPMFPNGVFYEDHDEKDYKKIIKRGPWQFRGESGANDNIIPTSDNLLQLTDKMPSNPLTEILKDFRTYRPLQHNRWLGYVYDYAKTVGVKEYALSSDNTSRLRYLGILDEIRDFRNRHWNFTKEYIIKRTDHPVATGGSPIVTWLPNQLGATLKAMEDVTKSIDTSKLSSEDKTYFDAIRSRSEGQRNILEREVAKLKERFPNQ